MRKKEFEEFEEGGAPSHHHAVGGSNKAAAACEGGHEGSAASGPERSPEERSSAPRAAPVDLVLAPLLLEQPCAYALAKEGSSFGFAHRQRHKLRSRFRRIRSRRADSRATRAFMDEDGDGDSRVEEEGEKGEEEEEGGGYCLQLMRRNWAKYHGTPNGIGVDWKRWSLETLERVAGGLGGAAVAAVCAAFSLDHGSASHGLPDLLFWAAAAPEFEGGGYYGVRFVEVKGPGDSVSPHQRLWLARLHELGVPAVVARVADE